MYILMMIEALDEPTTTYAVLSALMRPAVPFYIIINSLMELFIVPFAVLLNWDAAMMGRIYPCRSSAIFYHKGMDLASS